MKTTHNNTCPNRGSKDFVTEREYWFYHGPHGPQLYENYSIDDDGRPGDRIDNDLLDTDYDSTREDDDHEQHAEGEECCCYDYDEATIEDEVCSLRCESCGHEEAA